MSEKVKNKLTFKEKSRLNDALMALLKQHIVDKPDGPLPPEGKLYDTVDPHSMSLAGSIGKFPDPHFDGPQAPNSMGMVLLVEPDKAGEVKCSVSGQFDIVHRVIPDYSKMMEALTRDGDGDPKDKQVLLGTYRRFTLEFSDIDFKFNLPAEDKKWVVPVDASSLESTICAHESEMLKNGTIFRKCYLNDKGQARLTFDWSGTPATNQNEFNALIRNGCFETNEVLHYRVRLRARARKAPKSLCENENSYLIEFFLENLTSSDHSKPFGVFMPQLLDAGFKIKFSVGNNTPLPHRFAPEDYRLIDSEGLPGYGISCGVSYENGEYSTNSFPTSRQALIETPSPEKIGMKTQPTFADLASDPIPILKDMVQAIDRYADEWRGVIDSKASDSSKEQVAIMNLDHTDFIRERNNIEEGINLLQKNSNLLRSFKLMNEAIGEAVKIQGKSFDSWRLFQLGFILTQVMAVYERCIHKDKISSHLEHAEVLWFATGGGKTEAYLGILTMGMLYERINGRAFGVTGWMRFPLRMLSVQQFQRLGYVLAQANVIRQERGLGGHPFTVGYFTGSVSSPGFVTNDGPYYQDTFLPNLTDDKLHELQFVHDCTYCKAKDSIYVKADIERGRLMHVCSNPHCWSNTCADRGLYGEGIKGEIGIYVSDEECYRYIPTILVGTLDKLAVIGHNQRFRLLFGGGRFFCPEHGFTFDGPCMHKRIGKDAMDDYAAFKCGNNSRTTDVRTIDLGVAKIPGVSFMLQDELHLSRENLGNFDAHYQTLFNAIQEEMGGRRPKILAATATIKDYEHHVTHLYQRRARRFPAPGQKQNESFYSRIVPDEDGGVLYRRQYIGVMPLNNISNAIALMGHRYFLMLDDLRAQLRDDPTNTANRIGFDGSLAKLLVDHLDVYMNAALTYVNSKKSIIDVTVKLEEMTGEVEIPKKLDGETTLDDILQAIEHMENKRHDDPHRQLIATNVISHGVDIENLNFMILHGWPKSTAEYIQASARAGRVHPGIIISMFKHFNLYERNVFLNFEDYHFFLDKLVESVPISRFAPNVLERTFPGVLAAVLYNWAPTRAWGKNLGYNGKKLRDALLDNKFNVHQELKDILMKCLKVPDDINLGFDPVLVKEFNADLESKIDHSLDMLETLSSTDADQSIREIIGKILRNQPFRSFRDIERQIEIKPADNSLVEDVIDALSE